MATDLCQLLTFALDNYIPNKQLDLRGNPFAAEFKTSAKDIVSHTLDTEGLIVEASVGRGNWAEVPWICVFNPDITTSAQIGFYIGYWFCADMNGVYLVQGQGVTAVKDEFGRNCHKELERRTELIRARVPEFKDGFSNTRPVLKGKTPIAMDYEHGAAYCKFYARNTMPTADVLAQDLNQIVSLYTILVNRGGLDNIETAANLGGESQLKALSFEQQRRYVQHMRIERNPLDVKEAKRLFDPICMACGFDFEATYGGRGKGFIEAHHIVPLHMLPLREKVSIDPAKDIALLCSNCHRMIHRGPNTISVEELQEIIKNDKDMARA